MNQTSSVINAITLIIISTIMYFFAISESIKLRYLNEFNHPGEFIVVVIINASVLMLIAADIIRQMKLEIAIQRSGLRKKDIKKILSSTIESNELLKIGIKPCGNKWIKIYKDPNQTTSTILIATEDDLLSIDLDKSQMRSIRDTITEILNKP